MKTFKLILLSFFILETLSVSANEITVTKEVEIVFQVGERVLKPVRVGLFGLSVPKGTENFYELCTNRNLIVNGQKASYIGTTIHKIMYRHAMQGGDYLGGKGDKSQSIWGKPFDDEDLSIDHSEGSLSYMGMRRSVNGSLYIISLDSNHYMNKAYQVFGRITSGMEEINSMEKLAGSPTGPTKQIVKIIDCYPVKSKTESK